MTSIGGITGCAWQAMVAHKRRPRRPHLRRVQSVGMGVTSCRAHRHSIAQPPQPPAIKSLSLLSLGGILVAPRCGRSSSRNVPRLGGRSAPLGRAWESKSVPDGPLQQPATSKRTPLFCGRCCVRVFVPPVALSLMWSAPMPPSTPQAHRISSRNVPHCPAGPQFSKLRPCGRAPCTAQQHPEHKRLHCLRCPGKSCVCVLRGQHGCIRR